MSKPDWIVYDEVADFTQEQWANLLKFRSPLLRWNPNTSRMEPFKYTDLQGGAPSEPQAGRE